MTVGHGNIRQNTQRITFYYNIYSLYFPVIDLTYTIFRLISSFVARFTVWNQPAAVFSTWTMYIASQLREDSHGACSWISLLSIKFTVERIGQLILYVSFRSTGDTSVFLLTLFIFWYFLVVLSFNVCIYLTKLSATYIAKGDELNIWLFTQNPVSRTHHRNGQITIRFQEKE